MEKEKLSTAEIEAAKEKFFRLLFVKYNPDEDLAQHKLEHFYDTYKQIHAEFDLLERSKLRSHLDTYRRDLRGKAAQGSGDEVDLPSQIKAAVPTSFQ